MLYDWLFAIIPMNYVIYLVNSINAKGHIEL